jgi:hypothetical protein
MSTPNPSTTDWVPLWDLNGANFSYSGLYQAGTTYNDGAVVIGSDGIAYVCVKDGTTTAPVPWTGIYGPVGPAGPQGAQGPQGVAGPAGTSIPAVQNGKWLKGVAGAAVWTPIIETDVRGLQVADTAWHVIGQPGEINWQNGWTNYGAPFGPVQYRKLASGLVIFHGLATAAGTANATILTLPAGWQAAASRQWIFDAANSSAKYDEGFRMQGANLQSSLTSGWVSFMNVQYYAEG